MKRNRLLATVLQAAPRISVLLLIGSLCMMVNAGAQNLNSGDNSGGQNAAPAQENVKYGYTVHQSVDLGGHVASYSGSNAVYDTMVNLQTGPRILNQALDMRAVEGSQHFLFDSLFTGSTGYGGDPNNFTTFRMSKGRLYDFTGLFRRDRQYFDYNLFGNPLIPSGVMSNGYTFPQVTNSEHLFNTVRRMTDTNLTLFPLSNFHVRAGYAQNIAQGPTYSSIHMGTEALLLQNWRNSTDTWMGAVDYRPFPHTLLTYEQHFNSYKGNSSWQLAGLNLQLQNGTPVSLGFDNVTAPAATKASSACGANPAILNPGSATSVPIANACENGYLQYSRTTPTRTLFPTEEFRFQSADIKNFETNGRILYTDANMHLPSYNEYFNGNESRTTLRAATITGNAWAARFNVSADYGFVWQLAEKVSLIEQYDFQNFRQPAMSFQSEVDQKGTSMLAAPGPALAPANTLANNFLGQKTNTNTISVDYQVSPRGSISIGYRYRDRRLGFVQSVPTDALADGRNYTYNDRQNALLLGAVLRPTPNWKVNGTVEIGHADQVYVPIEPTNFEHYQLRTAYKPRAWATLSGTFNDTERKDNQLNVGYLAHNRSGSVGASLAPSERYSFDLSYGYSDVFSRTQSCFDDTAPPVDATPMPVGVACGNAVNTATSTAAYYGTSYYDAPTQYGSIGIVYTPARRMTTAVGYRMTANDGHYEMLNPLAVPGSLQSQYQSPYGSIGYTVAKGWAFRGDWNYYGYGEGSPVGPTLPRSFRGNVTTLGMHYEF